jgi:hypothetical protein
MSSACMTVAFFFAIISNLLAGFPGRCGAGAPLLLCSRSLLPQCGMTSGENITRCGMIVNGFLPLCGIFF